MRSGGFDAVIGNPPYDVLEKDRGKTSWPHAVLSTYVRATDEYEDALGYKLNLYRFFAVRSLNLTKVGGRYGMIMPLALLADITPARTRRHLMLTCRDLRADCFPQKDNPKRRIFRKAKLSTGVFTGERVGRLTERMAAVDVKVYPWNSFDDPHRDVRVRLRDAALLDRENLPIPLTDDKNWAVCRKIHSNPTVTRLGDVADVLVTRGEINQAIYRRYITSDPSKARMLKGVEVAQYGLNEELSQGEREWFDDSRFMKDGHSRPVVQRRRIATQRITGVDERLRIVATIIEPPVYFADSTNSIELKNGSPYALEYLLALFNSTLFQWRFKITNTNNNVGTNELDAMPMRTIDFGKADDRKRHDDLVSLVKQMIALRITASKSRLAEDQTALNRRLRAMNRRIEQSVYDLYGLPEKDIGIVERLEELSALWA
jgi:hypothetical protein